MQTESSCRSTSLPHIIDRLQRQVELLKIVAARAERIECRYDTCGLQGVMGLKAAMKTYRREFPNGEVSDSF